MTYRIGADLLRQVLVDAIRAPSSHNTQPWRFVIGANRITVYPDLNRRLPVVDPDDHALYISVGCALENLVISAAAHGLAADVEPFPEDDPEACARVDLSLSSQADDGGLARAIPERQSNRADYDGEPLSKDAMSRILDAARGAGVRGHAVTRGPALHEVAELAAEGARRQFSDPAFRRELAAWVRFNRRDLKRHGDGIFSGSLGMPPLPAWLGRLILAHLVSAKSQARQTRRQLLGSSAAVLMTADRDDRIHWLETGRAFERMALTATALGVRHAHMNMPCEVRELRSPLRDQFGPDTGVPLLLLRLGHAPLMPGSIRRPLETVVVS